jgi:DNA-binding SARP family transcriptional activator
VGSGAEKPIARNVVDALGSLLTALLVFGATPTVLVTVVGNPLDGGLGHGWGQGGRLALAGIALVAWLAWLGCCTQLTRSVIAQVRRGHVSTPAGAAVTERVAARIAAGVLSLLALATPLALTAGAGAATGTTNSSSPLAQPVNASGAGPSVSVGSSTTVATAEAAPVAAAAALSYVVQPGDTLWSIAKVQLGAGDDWPAIAALNLGRAMPDGLHFVDPSRIYAGWTLQLPDLPPESAAPVAVTTAPATPAPVSTPVPAVTTTTSLAPAAPSVAPVINRRPESLPAPVVTLHAAATASSTSPDPDGGSPDGAGPGHLNLPELSALGIGALACAALARRSRRIRMLRQNALAESEDEPRDEDGPGLAHSDEAIDADVLLRRFSGVPALEAFEAANYGLGRAMAEAQGDASRAGVDIRAVCVGAAGVDLWLAEPGTPAPPGFTLSADGQAWHAAHDSFTGRDGTWPFMPIVLTVGEDEAGTWLVPLAPGRCLPLVGEAGGDLWRAARCAQEAWSWADIVLITEDPAIVGRELRLHDGGEGPLHAPHILFFGDPAQLSPADAREVSIVTRSLVPGSDVTVLVDRHAASIHPLGRTVRPHLMQSRTADLVGELVADPSAVATPLGPPHGDDLESGGTPGRNDPFALRDPAADGRPPGLRARTDDHDVTALPVSSPGTVEVKLLTATPRLEGLSAALPANRARRATELVAYLALHNGEDVTSDRLRTRVLGSADADAASQTLFNIAAVARSAMGLHADGTSLFPSGSRTGLYRISQGVSVDVHQAAALAAEGSATADPETAIDLLHLALSLVEGEPMANALSGYAWWEAEGHGARIAAVLVNAASNLAALAVDAGRFELAQWGLNQARLVDPYSEAISRVAMQVAAAAGDADRLRREWKECQRRIDELDPGSTPSPRTERLYCELAQRVLVGDDASAT